MLNKTNKNKPTIQTSVSKEPSLIARCVWWGEEETNGAIFRPKTSNQDEKKTQTTAKYVVRSGFKQFNAYLNGTLSSNYNLS